MLEGGRCPREGKVEGVEGIENVSLKEARNKRRRIREKIGGGKSLPGCARLLCTFLSAPIIITIAAWGFPRFWLRGSGPDNVWQFNNLQQSLKTPCLTLTDPHSKRITGGCARRTRDSRPGKEKCGGREASRRL